MNASVIEEIYKSAVKLLEPLGLNETYKVIVDEAGKLVEAEHGSIYLSLDGELKRVFSSSPPQYRLKPRKKGFTHKAYKEQRAIVLKLADVKKIHPEWEGEGIKFFIMIPLSFGGESIGVLTLQAKKGAYFSKDKLEILKLFGSLATLKIRNVNLLEQVSQTLALRDRFISITSHELRTPLTTLHGYIELVKRDISIKKTVSLERINKIESQSKRLSILVGDLLRFDQFKKVVALGETEVINLEKSLKSAILDLHFRYPEYKVRLIRNLRFGASVRASPIRLTQVFNNILANAAKFSPEESTITVIIRSNRKRVRVEVSDKGSGIKPKDLKRIFTEFYKAPGNTRQGLGLGLYIAKNIVEDYGGRIKISSRLGKGTKVIVELPTVPN